MNIPIRYAEPGNAATHYGLGLHLIQDQSQNGMPIVQLSIHKGSSGPLLFNIRFHTRAGIPVASAQVVFPPNTMLHVTPDLQVLGLDAYKHASQEEQQRIMWRICSRIDYASTKVE